MDNLNYNVPSIPKINKNVPEDYIGKYLTQLFDSMSGTQLNKLYSSVYYLKM